jgi:glycosyltransferase involved in cell wall biosynthesis
MKIAFVNEGIYEYAMKSAEGVGGIERDLWLLARALATAGWSPIVGVRGAVEAGKQKIIDGVRYVGLGSGKALWTWYRLFSVERPNWLLWEGATHLLGPLVEIAKITGARTIFHTAFDTDVQPRQALCLRPRWWPLYAWGLSRADLIFVQHEGQFSKLPPRWQFKASVLPKVCNLSNGLYEKVVVKPHSLRAEYVAWVAMLRQPKRPELLIEIARKAPNISFVVCGGVTSHRSMPGYGERIVDLLRQLPNVDYRGQLRADQAAQVIADAAVLLSTSEEEGFPNTFIQAFASGTPVVSLKVDPDGIIESGRLGSLAGSIEKAIQDMNAFLNSPEERERIAARGRRHIAKAHSEAAVIGVFEKALRATC